MQTILAIVIPTIILPVMLTIIFWKLHLRFSIVQLFIPLIWLASFFIISGTAALSVSEAKDWLWVLVGLSALLILLFKSNAKVLNYLHYLLITIILIVISWPVLRYQYSVTLIIEMLLIALAAIATQYYFVANIKHQSNTRHSIALILALSFTGLALVIVLAGSLLIGELAGIAATIFSVFAILNLVFNNSAVKFNVTYFIPLIQLYFAILLLARIYVELSLVLTALLLIAPIAAVISKQRYGFIYTTICVISAISWLIITTDSSSYY